MISEVKRDKSAKLKENDLSPLPYFDWDKAKYFYYVARLKSFNQAGQFLKISQSGLSRKVQTLESHLGFRVFSRNQKGVELTRKGEQLFDIVESTFLNLKKLSFDPVVKINDGQKRLIRIATTHAIAAYIIDDILIDYSQQNSNIIFELVTEDYLIDLIINDVDVAIRPLDLEAKNIEQDLLFNLQRRLYASEDYIKRFGEPKEIEDLKQHQIIGPAKPKDFPYSELEWILKLGLPRSERHQPVFTSTSIECLIKAAQKGLGIIASYHNMAIIKNSNLINVLPEVRDKSIKWYFSYSTHLKNDLDIQQVKQFLLEKLNC